MSCQYGLSLHQGSLTFASFHVLAPPRLRLTSSHFETNGPALCEGSKQPMEKVIRTVSTSPYLSRGSPWWDVCAALRKPSLLLRRVGNSWEPDQWWDMMTRTGRLGQCGPKQRPQQESTASHIRLGELFSVLDVRDQKVQGYAKIEYDWVQIAKSRLVARCSMVQPDLSHLVQETLTIWFGCSSDLLMQAGGAVVRESRRRDWIGGDWWRLWFQMVSKIWVVVGCAAAGSSRSSWRKQAATLA